MPFTSSALGRSIAAASAAVFALMLLSACRNEASTPDDSAIAAIARGVDDEKQIRALIIRYGQYHDATDYASFARLFAREGEWTGLLEGEIRTVKGPENIQATMEKTFADRKYDPEHITNLHLISNVLIEVSGDKATGYSRWTVLSRNEKDEPYVRLSGRYEDVFVREDGQWKFASRTVRREIP